jgi:hypothetical protein
MQFADFKRTKYLGPFEVRKSHASAVVMAEEWLLGNRAPNLQTQTGDGVFEIGPGDQDLSILCEQDWPRRSRLLPSISS